MPSVVVQAVGADGRDTLDVAVTCDGVRLAERLDGRAMPMDPGLHSCRFEMSAAVREEQIVLREGEQRKPWRISFAPPADAKPEAVPAAPAGPIPPAAWVLGGVGLAAIGVGTVFEIHGFSQKSDLDRCRPACARSSVDATRASFIVGDVAIGVGLVSVAAGALLALSRRPPVAEPPRARLDVTPYVGQGAGLRFEGAF